MIFDCVHLLYYKCHRINFRWDGLYIDSTAWIKSKKSKINLINKKDNKCFQYAITVILNHEEIVKILEEQKFIKFNWEIPIKKSIEKNLCKII